MPDRFPRLSTSSSYGRVWIEGRFYTNHEEIFGTDLLEAGYVPVAAKIFLRSGGDNEEDSRISLEDIRPTLYLADGTALEFASYDRITVDGYSEGRITEEALDINLIKPEEQSEEGFLFFKFPRAEFLITGDDTLVHLKTPLAYEIRISDSLIGMEYFTEDGTRPIYVGLRKDRRPDSS